MPNMFNINNVDADSIILIIHMKIIDSVEFSYKSYRWSQAFHNITKKTTKVYDSSSKHLYYTLCLLMV